MYTLATKFKLEHFINLAGASLVGAALVKVLTNLASPGLVQPHEPVLGVSIDTLLWILAAIEMAVAWICLFGQRPTTKLFLLSWLGACYLVYLCGLVAVKAYIGFGVYLVSVYQAFRVPGGFVFFAFQVMAIYIATTGAVGLLLLRRKACRFTKTACLHCGGHIEFPTAGIGRMVPCPHCKASVTLRHQSPQTV